MIERSLDRVSLILALMGTGIGIMIALLLCAEAVMRNGFDHTWIALEDILSLLSIAGIALCFPLGLFDDTHIRVELMDAVYPDWLRRGLDLLSRLTTLGLFGLLLWQLVRFAQNAAGDQTPIMGYPAQPVWWVVTGAVGASVAIQAFRIFVPKSAE